MFDSLKHAVRHTEFFSKHPLITFALVTIGAVKGAELVLEVARPKPSTSNPVPPPTT